MKSKLTITIPLDEYIHLKTRNHNYVSCFIEEKSIMSQVRNFCPEEFDSLIYLEDYGNPTLAKFWKKTDWEASVNNKVEKENKDSIKNQILSEKFTFVKNLRLNLIKNQFSIRQIEGILEICKDKYNLAELDSEVLVYKFIKLKTKLKDVYSPKKINELIDGSINPVSETHNLLRSKLGL